MNEYRLFTSSEASGMNRHRKIFEQSLKINENVENSFHYMSSGFSKP